MMLYEYPGQGAYYGLHGMAMRAEHPQPQARSSSPLSLPPIFQQPMSHVGHSTPQLYYHQQQHPLQTLHNLRQHQPVHHLQWNSMPQLNQASSQNTSPRLSLPLIFPNVSRVTPARQHATPIELTPVPPAIPPKTPPKDSYTYQQLKRRRGGWWGGKKDIKKEQERVKELVRKNGSEEVDLRKKNFGSGGVGECLRMEKSDVETKISSPSSKRGSVAGRRNVPESAEDVEHPVPVAAEVNMMPSEPRAHQGNSRSKIINVDKTDSKVPSPRVRPTPPLPTAQLQSLHSVKTPSPLVASRRYIKSETVKSPVITFSSKTTAPANEANAPTQHTTFPQEESQVATQIRSPKSDHDESAEITQLKTKLASLEQRLATVTSHFEKQRSTLRELATIDTSNFDFSPLTCTSLLISQLANMNLHQSISAISRESGMPNLLRNREILLEKMSARQFSEAIDFAATVEMEHMDVIVELSRCTPEKVEASFGDLTYVITKYHYIAALEEKAWTTASKALSMSIKKHVDAEVSKGGQRAKWFAEDFTLLSSLLPSSSSKAAPTPALVSFLNTWSWESELKLFWDAAAAVWNSHLSSPSSEYNCPLFAIALAFGFSLPEIPEYWASAFKRWQSVEQILQRKEDKAMKKKSSSMSTESLGRTKSSENLAIKNVASDQTTSKPPLSTPAFNSKQSSHASDLNVTQDASQEERRAIDENADTSHNVEMTDCIRVNDRKGSVPKSSYDHVTEYDSKSTLTSQSQSHAYGDNEALMPPQSSIRETADFAFSGSCGPVLGRVRALDVVSIPETGEVFCATAGTDGMPSSSDRKISIWLMHAPNGSVATPVLWSQLDNGTSKSVLTLTFHPQRPEWLISSDLDFDVKLWDWKQGICLKTWKKLHTRIIHRVSIVPHSPDRAVSCSGDQSIKFFWLTDDPSTSSTKDKGGERKVQSVHANEPFTSFTFSGDSQGQILVATLSYAIRIYKMRTMSLLHTIHLPELKSNKTPITAINSHPLYDNYVLISSDNRVLLYDLTSETALRSYSTREILPGTRIEGLFSPCGTFVYAGCADTKTLSNKYKRPDSVMYENARAFSRKQKYGLYIWRLHNGKMEKAEMAAMFDSNDAGGNSPVVGLKWINSRDYSQNEPTDRKVLVTASLDKVIRVFM